MMITLPSVLWQEKPNGGNVVRQIRESKRGVEGTLTPINQGRTQWHLFRSQDNNESVLIVPKNRRIPNDFTHVSIAEVTDPSQDVDISEGRWLKHPLLPETGLNYEDEIKSVMDSWNGAFLYAEENLNQNRPGLRKPQLGALHAIHAHWSTSSTAATIVMPTGTGKTETMLSILVSTLCTCLLVVVPTDALRAQIADKFLTLGILKYPDSTVMATRAKHPIVGTLLHVPSSIEDVLHP